MFLQQALFYRKLDGHVLISSHPSYLKKTRIITVGEIAEISRSHKVFITLR